MVNMESVRWELKDRTDRPFGVNFRSDQDDVDQRVDLFIAEGVKVASFALAPRPELIHPGVMKYLKEIDAAK